LASPASYLAGEDDKKPLDAGGAPRWPSQEVEAAWRQSRVVQTASALQPAAESVRKLSEDGRAQSEEDVARRTLQGREAAAALAELKYPRPREVTAAIIQTGQTYCT
jgi:hypothetical protein